MMEETAGNSTELPLMPERLCEVCYEKSDGSHFGADACRACAAFFRRTIVSGRKYYCNQGDGKCEVNKGARCMCRKCRFQKCYTVGMKAEMVQGRRDSIHPKPPVIKENPIGINIPTPVLLTRCFVPIAEPPEPQLLKKISTNYQQLRVARKRIELSMYPEIGGEIHLAGPLKGFCSGTSQRLNTLTKAYAPAFWDFASNTFQEFDQLDHFQKMSLFTSFCGLVWGMDKCYMTYKAIPREMFDTISIVTETMYFDKNNCDYWITDCPAQCFVVKEELISIMKNAMSRPRIKQVLLMEEMKIEDEEYAALLGLMLWNQNFEEENKKIEVIVKNMREMIFKELEIYYRSKGISSYAERLGALMGVHSTVLVDVFRMREDLELYNLLNALQKDSPVMEALRNIRRF